VAAAVGDWGTLIPEQSDGSRPAERFLKIAEKKVETRRADICSVNSTFIDYFSNPYSHRAVQNQSNVKGRRRKNQRLVLNLKFVFPTKRISGHYTLIFGCKYTNRLCRPFRHFSITFHSVKYYYNNCF